MKKLLLLLSLFVIQNTYAQKQITDFSYKEGDEGSYPTDIVEFNGHIFFVATTRSFGKEVWVSTGHPNEASLLKDINPGGNYGVGSYFKETSVILNNKLYFIAKDGLSNGEIWSTDGTTEGTQKVTHFLNNDIKKLTLVGDKFYFLISKNNLLQVWHSDGTEAGTKIVRDDIPAWSTPSYQGKCNNTFIFTFQAYGTNDSRVWRSDGTSSGTFPITDNIDGNGAGPGGTSALTQYIELNNELYFVSRYFLHKTDGTLENTKKITSFHRASTRLIDYADVIVINGKLYFSFFEVDYNRLFIWETDGTESGSSKIYDEAGDRYFMTSNLVNCDNHLVFCGKNLTGGTSPIKMDLQTYKTSYLGEIEENKEAPIIFSKRYDCCTMRQIGDHRFFISSQTDDRKRKGWISDFAEGTNLNIICLNEVFDVFLFGDLFYFSKYSDAEGRELWQSDGTEAQTLSCDNINKSKYGLRYTSWATTNSSLFFNANDGITGEEPWVYEDEKATNLKDIYVGEFGSYPEDFISYNKEIYYTAADDIHGRELWKSDGTEAGTKLLGDISEDSSSSYPDYLSVYKDGLFFTAFKDGHQHLCKTNGMTTEFIKDLGVNDYGSAYRVTEMISSNDYLYFVTEGAGEDLWISDGTENGTFKLKDFYTCSQLSDVNGKLFFTAFEAYKGERELWTTDGSEAGTLLVKDIGSGYSSEPKELFSFNNSLFFTAYTEDNGREIWQSDGTAGGTTQLADINSGSKSSIINANFCLLNDHLYFNADNGTNGFELWKTNGSESGTSLVKDINPGLESSQPSQMVTIQNRIYFQAYNAKYGVELWKYDDAENDVELVVDIFSGIQSSNPTDIIGIADDIYFIAESPKSGRQFWKMGYNEVICRPVLAPIPDVANLPDITGECSASIDTEPTATDDCGNTLVGRSADPLTYSEQGTYTIIWNYKDSEGNSSTQEQIVIVDDVIKPVLSVQNTEVFLDESGNASITARDIVISASDNCAIADTLLNQLTFNCSDVGSPVNVDVTINDVNGNSMMETSQITVSYEMSLAVTCVDDRTIDIEGGQTVYTVSGAEFDPLVTTDNCGLESLVNDYNQTATLEGAKLPLGRTTITWTVTDKAGNIESCSFDITVNSLVGIEDLEENDISIYPNPTTDYLSLKVDDFGKASYSYQLYNVNGVLLECKNIEDNITTIAMSHLVSAVYFIRLTKKQEEIKTFKVFKK